MNALTRTLNRSFTLGQSLGWLGIIITLLLLGAHFYRASEYGIAASCVGLVVFACVDSAWKQYAVALFLFWGMIEWGESAFLLAKVRMVMGVPWIRGAGILCAVALVTGLAGWYAFRRAEAKAATSEEARPLFQGIIFICTFVTLFYLRQAAKMDMFLLERYVPLLGSVQIWVAAWYGAFVAGRLVDPKHSRKTRKGVWLLFACVFFAQFALGVLGFERMLLTGKLHAPIPAFIIFAPIFRESFSMMPIIVLIATLLAGSAWCSMLCYFGPFDSFAAGNKAVRPYSPAMRAALTYGRPAVLVAGSLAAVALRLIGISTLSAICIVVVFAVFSLMLMGIFSRKYHGMVHCTTFCPMGLVATALGKISPWRVRVDAERCDNCGACEKICMYSAITPESRAKGKTLFRCSLCRDCITTCKQKALYVHCPGLSRENAWTVFVGLLTVLHVIFIATAMV